MGISVFSTPLDMVIFGQMFVNLGRYDDEPTLPPAPAILVVVRLFSNPPIKSEP